MICLIRRQNASVHFWQEGKRLSNMTVPMSYHKCVPNAKCHRPVNNTNYINIIIISYKSGGNIKYILCRVNSDLLSCFTR